MKSRLKQSSSSQTELLQHTLSTLSWPWRDIGEIYTEMANPSECFFSVQIQMLLLTDKVTSRGTKATSASQQQLDSVSYGMSQDCLPTLLKAVLLQNFSDTRSDPSPILHQNKCTSRCLQGGLPNHVTKSLAPSSPWGNCTAGQQPSLSWSLLSKQRAETHRWLP